MTAKQWKIIDEEFISYIIDEEFISYTAGGTAQLISNGECEFWLWHDKEETQKVCDKLNSILDENEQLKKENKWLKSIHFTNDVLKENKLLKEKLNEILELTELTGMIHLRKAEIKSIIKR